MSTKVNNKLKIILVELLQNQEYCSLSGITVEAMDELKSQIYSYLDKEHYFVYKRGSTKFNDQLLLESKANLQNYFSNEYTIIDVHSLDSFKIGIYDGYQNDMSITECIELDANGIFESMLMNLSKDFNFDPNESTLPNLSKDQK